MFIVSRAEERIWLSSGFVDGDTMVWLRMIHESFRNRMPIE